MKKMNTLFAVAIFATVITACNNEANTETKVTVEPKIDTAAAANADGTFCFVKALNRDTTSVSLTIAGNAVTGKMIWNPYQKDGAVGTLTGTRQPNGELELLYDYMIEGNKQTETKIMKIENDNLIIKKGELIDAESNGQLKYKNVAAAIFSDTLTKDVCK